MLLSCLLVSVSALEKPTGEFYVGDFADVFSAEHEEYYIEQGKLLQESCSGAQVAVVSVPSLEGETIEQYANDLFNDWGIGDKEENNGLLILLAPNERQI